MIFKVVGVNSQIGHYWIFSALLLASRNKRQTKLVDEALQKEVGVMRKCPSRVRVRRFASRYGKLCLRWRARRQLVVF